MIDGFSKRNVEPELRGVFKSDRNWLNFQTRLANSAKIIITMLQNTHLYVIYKNYVFEFHFLNAFLYYFQGKLFRHLKIAEPRILCVWYFLPARVLFFASKIRKKVTCLDKCLDNNKCLCQARKLTFGATFNL
jgi:hypothetical protein